MPLIDPDFEENVKYLGRGAQYKFGKNKNKDSRRNQKSRNDKGKKNTKEVRHVPAPIIDQTKSTAVPDTPLEHQKLKQPLPSRMLLMDSETKGDPVALKARTQQNRRETKKGGKNGKSDENKEVVQPFTFQALPAELRNMMYDHIVLDQHSCMGLLFSCRQIHRELLGVCLRDLNFNVRATMGKEAQKLDQVVSFVRDACASHMAQLLNKNNVARAEVNVGITFCPGLLPSSVPRPRNAGSVSGEFFAERIVRELQNAENMDVRFRVRGWRDFRYWFKARMESHIMEMPGEFKRGVKISINGSRARDCWME